MNNLLQSIAKRIQAKLKYKNYSVSLTVIRGAIDDLGTEYKDITNEEIEKLVLQISNSSSCDATSAPIVRIEKQTLDNLVENQNTLKELNTMQDSNTNNNGSSLELTQNQSSALTFSDDFAKAKEVTAIAVANGIKVKSSQALQIAEGIPDRFKNAYDLQATVVLALDNLFGEAASAQSEALVNKVNRFKENRRLENDRLRFEVSLAMSETSEYTEQTTESMLEIMAAAVGVSKETLRAKAMEIQE